MKIHGGKRDYYDSVVSFGLDPKLHYDRRQFPIDYDKLKNKISGPLEKSLSRYESCSSWSVKAKLRTEFNERLLVGFCGRFYPCIQASTWDPKGIKHTESVYSLDDLLESSPYYKQLVIESDQPRRRRWDYQRGPRKRREDFFECRSLSV